MKDYVLWMLYAVDTAYWRFSQLCLQVIRFEPNVDLVKTDESNLLHSFFKKKQNINIMLEIGIKYCDQLEKKLEIRPFENPVFTRALRILLQVHRHDLRDFKEIQQVYVKDSDIKPVQYWKYIDLFMNEAIQTNTSWVDHSKYSHNLNRLFIKNSLTLPDWLFSHFTSFKMTKVIAQDKALRSGKKTYNKSKPPITYVKRKQYKKKNKPTNNNFQIMMKATKKILQKKFPNEPNKKWDRDFCGYWNTIGCNFENCSRQHVCCFCFDESHKAGDCPLSN